MWTKPILEKESSEGAILYMLTLPGLTLTNELCLSPPGRGISKRSRDKDVDVSEERDTPPLPHPILSHQQSGLGSAGIRKTQLSYWPRMGRLRFF